MSILWQKMIMMNLSEKTMILMLLNNCHWSSSGYDEHFMTKDDNDEFVLDYQDDKDIYFVWWETAVRTSVLTVTNGQRMTRPMTTILLMSKVLRWESCRLALWRGGLALARAGVFYSPRACTHHQYTSHCLHYEISFIIYCFFPSSIFILR